MIMPAELLWPAKTNKKTVTQLFSATHPAADIRAPEGTPLVAVADIVITSYKFDKSAGNALMFYIPSLKLYGCYYHLSKCVCGKPGMKVNQGTVIGYSGHTGNCSPPGVNGAHLHFALSAQLTKYGFVDKTKAVNPLSKNFRYKLAS